MEIVEVGSNPYSIFVYAIRSKLTRDYYLRRLRKFFDFLGIEQLATIEGRCSTFAELAKSNNNWVVSSIIRFLQFQKERVEAGQITGATLRNYVKAIKLFCEMSDIQIPWKKIVRGLPKVRKYAEDRAPTLDEIRKMAEYPDRRIKAVIYTMASSGIRVGAWDYLRWGHIKPIERNGKTVAAKMIAHGRRGYHGNYMFVWIGAAVDIPYRVHKLLATLGPKLYFFRLPFIKKRSQEIIDQLDENFENKRKEVQWAVIDFLTWHEVNPNIFTDEETQLPKVRWNSQNDEKRAKDYLASLGELLGRLRGHVDIWSESRSSFKEHEYSEYSYSFTQTEDPTRATTQLYNLARGHALLEGRSSISLQHDLPIAVKVALSTASVERVAIIDLLLSKQNGELVLSDVADALSMSKATALKAMTELKALKVVDMAETKVECNDTTKITLMQEFGWLFDKEFTKLREGFRPIDNSSYLTTREKIVLEEMEKLENNISPITTMEGSNRLVPKQSLYDLLKSDGFQDDNSINAIIYSLMHKGKIYEFKAEEGGSMFYGIVAGGDEVNNSDDTQEQDHG